MKASPKLTPGEQPGAVTEQQHTNDDSYKQPPLSDAALKLLSDRLDQAYASAGMVREWKGQCKSAWRRTNYGKRIQLMKFAGMDYVAIGMYSELDWDDIPYAPRHKLEEIFRHLAEWVWSNFQDERARAPGNLEGAAS